MAYKVTLKTPSGEQVIECADDTYILDAAEEAGTFGSYFFVDDATFKIHKASVVRKDHRFVELTF